MKSLVQKVSCFLARLRAFTFPVAGWKQRIQRYKNGNTVWLVPFAPAGSNIAVGPWPIEWTPCTISYPESSAGTPGIHLNFLTLTSVISGRVAEGEDAAACARCGIHLHVADTKMENNLDVPLCPWCVKVAG
jgi:hypothetical protein